MLLYLQKIIQLLEETFTQLIANPRQACNDCQSSAIALSGGLDSTILAYLLKEQKPQAVSIVAKDFVGTDLVFCQIAAKEFGLPLTILKADTATILDAIEDTVSILKNFNDIEIRNNIVMYLAIKWAKYQGSKSIITGDGADELFAGYNFLLNKTESELRSELERIFSIMHFPSQKIGEALGVNVVSPYLDENFKEFANNVPSSMKVRKEKGTTYGKWILRKTFEHKIPSQIVWRQKSAMQDGSGTSQLTELFNHMISDETFLEKRKKIEKEFNVILRSKESLHYFEIFRRLHDLEQSKDTAGACPYCRHKTENSKFCRMCGAFPI